MKNYLLFLLIATISIFSCKKDACEDVVCFNEGICTDGNCDCPLGFEGEECELFTRDKMLGNFTLEDSCFGESSSTNEWGIGASANAYNEILINNFHLPAVNINAVITGENSFEIVDQFIPTVLGITINGTGIIEEDGKFSLEYTAIYGIVPDTVNYLVFASRIE